MQSKLEKDSKVRGLYRNVGATKESWLVKSRIKGGPVKSITIGDCTLINVAQARQTALTYLAEMAQGVDPIAKQASKSSANISLEKAIEKYLSQRRDNLKKSTLQDYRRVLRRNLGKWMSRPMVSISRDEVIEAYHKIIEEVSNRSRVNKTTVNAPGVAEADKTMRYLRSVFEFYVDDPLPDNSGLLLPYGNPVSVLKRKKIRREIKRRSSYLNLEQRLKLRDFLTDASHYLNPNGTTRIENAKTKVKAAQADWMLLLMLTGLRFNEPLHLTWSDVNFDNRTFTVSVNKSNRALTLPMSPMICAIFERRHAASAQKSLFVFPQEQNPAKPATMAKVAERFSAMSGVQFTPHDLRRTQATVLSQLGYQLSDIGRILNHARLNQTDEYIQTDIERIREAFIRVEEMLFEIDSPDFDTSAEL